MARSRIARLPKAPLAEVVFELQWKLPEGLNIPPQLRSDPGLLPLLDNFTRRMRSIGFGTSKDMAPNLPSAAHSVVRRYFRKPESPFPIMQVGPGIFASNESSLYEWGAFRRQVRLGLSALLASYPRRIFALVPSAVELRYIDAFDSSLLGKAAMFDFAQRGTSLKFELPPMLNDGKIFAGDADGRFIFERALKGWKNSRFILDFASGKSANKEDIVRVETKVRWKDDEGPAIKIPGMFLREMDKWLEFAHGITSPFFKQLVLPEVMQKFEGA